MSNRTPKYRKHSTSNNALVCIDGRRHYLGRFGSRESKERYARLLAQHFAGVPIEPTSTRAASHAELEGFTIAEVCAAYYQHASAYYRKDGAPTKTIYAIKISLEVLDGLFGETNAADFDTAAFDTLIASMVKKEWSRPYVNKHVGQIKRLFKWAARRKLVPVKVWHEVQLVGGLQLGRTTAREPMPVEPVAESVVEATLPHLPTIVQDMIRLQRATGARPGEICLLRPCDLDRSGDVWTFRPHRHKLQHRAIDRTIYIGPTGQAVLLRYLLREPTAYCFSPREAMVEVQAARRERRKTGVQPSQICRKRARPKRQPGERYTTGSYAVAVQRAALRADKEAHRKHPDADVKKRLVPAWSPNQLRHLAATKIRAEFGLESAAAILGHTRVSTTEIYAQSNKQRAIDVVRGIG